MLNPSRILSGIQPTLSFPHIGNYFGALQHWANLQDSFEKPIFLSVDLHALTSTKRNLKQQNRQIIACLLSCGIDPEKSILSIQSHLGKQHSYLFWLLNTIAPMNRLGLMTQYKDKIAANKSVHKAINLGLFSYPVLMAADILLYQTQYVPVGEDQKQHLELAQELVKSFHHITETENPQDRVFTYPKPYIPPIGGRILSLRDPTKKMSKSDSSEKSRISIVDDPQTIQTNISKAVTDSLPEIGFDYESRPGIKNLLEIYCAAETNLTGLNRDIVASSLNDVSSIPQTSLLLDSIVEKHFVGKPTSFLKNAVSEKLIQVIQPIHQRYYDLEKNPEYIDSIVQQGYEQLFSIAEDTIFKAEKALTLK